MTRFHLLLVVLVVAAAGTLLAFFRPSSRLVHQLVVREQPDISEAIVILLGGTAIERPQLALNLYNQKMARKIIFCAGFEVSGWKTWWYHKKGWISLGKTFRIFFSRNKIPDSDVDMVECPGIHDTSSEVLALARYLERKHYRNVLIVTSASHSRRASMVWKRNASNINGIMVAARDPGLKYWWRSRSGQLGILYEYLALAKELLRPHIAFNHD